MSWPPTPTVAHPIDQVLEQVKLRSLREFHQLAP